MIRGSNLSEAGQFDSSEFVFVSNEKAAELRPNWARPGDIVVTQRGTLGQIGRIPSSVGYDNRLLDESVAADGFRAGSGRTIPIPHLFIPLRGGLRTLMTTTSSRGKSASR